MADLFDPGFGLADAGAEFAEIVGSMSELGETAVLAGSTVNVIGNTPYRGALMAGTEVEGRVTELWMTAAAFDAAGGSHGDAVTFRSVAYTVGRIERQDPGLVRLELVR